MYDTFVSDNPADDATKYIPEENVFEEIDEICQKGLNFPETGIHRLHDPDFPKYKPVEYHPPPLLINFKVYADGFYWFQIIK